MLELRFVAPDLRRLDEASAEVIVCGVWRDVRPLTGVAGLLDWRLGGRLSRLARTGFLGGDVGELVAYPCRPRLTFDKLLAAGLGPRASFDAETLRKVLVRVHEALRGLAVRKAILELPGRGDGVVDPELAADVLFDVLGEGDAEGVTLIEEDAAQRRVERRLAERQQSAARSQPPPPTKPSS